MEFGIVGTSIWQQNMPLLERFTVDRAVRQDKLNRLKAELCLDELIYLSTCNRVEFIYVRSSESSGNRVLHQIIDFFFRNDKELSFFPNDFYHYKGKDAVTHLFRMASSLESLVVGETQITGQLKEACEEASSCGLAGPVLDSLAREAFMVARNVRRDTSLGQGALSMASLAVSELKLQLGATDSSMIALIGSGPMSLKLARYIKEEYLGELLFVNRTLPKAEQLAADFGGTAVALDEFLKGDTAVDAIASSTASPEPIFDRAFIERLARKEKSIVCIDLAIPRDFAADLSGSEYAKLIDIPLLKSRGQGNLRQKFIEAARANEIVREAVEKYLSDQMEVSLKPIFQNSYQESVELARRALDDLFARRVTNLGQDEKEAVHRLVLKLIGHSSFQPVKKLSGHLARARSELNLPDPLQQHKEAI